MRRTASSKVVKGRTYVAAGVVAMAIGGVAAAQPALAASGTAVRPGAGDAVTTRAQAAQGARIQARAAQAAAVVTQQASSGVARRMLRSAPRQSTGRVTYYVDPAGDDGADGTARQTAFRTLAAVNALDLHPGDKVLLKGGATFTGGLTLDAADAGTAAAPVVIGNYGGRATIDAGGGSGIVVHNAGGVTISGLTIVGTGLASGDTTTDGVLFYEDLDGGVRLPAVSVSNVDVSGFGNAGVEVGAWNQSWSGFASVAITKVRAHGNGDVGISTFGYFKVRSRQYSLTSVTVEQSKAYDNQGLAGKGDNSGSGIELGGVSGGAVRHSEAYRNGARNDAASGPAGIMVWDSSKVTVADNLSHNNRTSSVGGSGFAFQGGVQESSMFGNSASDNAGSGFLVAQPAGFRPTAGNALSYNLSIGNGRKAGGGIELAGPMDGSGVQDTDVFRNVAWVHPVDGSTPAALLIDDPVDTAAVHDNVFITSASLPLVSAVGGSDALSLSNNTYLTGAGDFLVSWDGQQYTSKDAFSAATGQEAAAS